MDFSGLEKQGMDISGLKRKGMDFSCLEKQGMRLKCAYFLFHECFFLSYFMKVISYFVIYSAVI